MHQSRRSAARRFPDQQAALAPASNGVWLACRDLSGLSLLGGTIYAADTVQGRLVRLAVPR